MFKELFILERYGLDRSVTEQEGWINGRWLMVIYYGNTTAILMNFQKNVLKDLFKELRERKYQMIRHSWRIRVIMEINSFDQ